MEIANANEKRDSIIRLLSAENLPVGDLPKHLENFIVAMEDNEVIGVIGLEEYGNYGLLRSLTVSLSFRDFGIAGKLIEQIEYLACSKGLTNIYLLTETASAYFTKKGYTKITRFDVPDEVQQSSEFSHVCPQSAIVMTKKII
jgi:amino-acid N-acetyltransferase